MALNLNGNAKTATGAAINLSKVKKVERGARINLSKEQPTLKRILMKLMWVGADLDATVVLLNENDTFIRTGDATSMVYYGNPDADGIKHGGDIASEDGDTSIQTEEVELTLADIATEVQTLSFVASSHVEEAKDKKTFGLVPNAKALLINADTNEALYEFDLEEDHSTATAVEMVKVYRKGGDFRVTSLEADIGTHHMGLQAVLDKYDPES